MDVKINIILIFLFMISCLEPKKNDSIKPVQTFFYFDTNNERMCKVPNRGLNSISRDSMDLKYFSKNFGNKGVALQDRGKLIYSFCNYGKLVFDSSYHHTFYTHNIDTLELVIPTNEIDFNHSLRNKNYIIEPLNDLSYRIREVRNAYNINLKR